MCKAAIGSAGGGDESQSQSVQTPALSTHTYGYVNVAGSDHNKKCCVSRSCKVESAQQGRYNISDDKALVTAGNSRRPPQLPFSHYYSYRLIRFCLNTRRSYFPSCLFPLLTAIFLVPLCSCRQGAVPIFSIKIIKMMRLEERHRCTLSRAERWSLISFSSLVLSSAPFHPSSNTFNCSFHVVLFGNWDWSTGNLNGNLVLKIIIIIKKEISQRKLILCPPVDWIHIAVIAI